MRVRGTRGDRTPALRRRAGYPSRCPAVSCARLLLTVPLSLSLSLSGSKFIQLISKVTLKDFMDNFNVLAAQAHESDDAFYAKRGVAVHSLEVSIADTSHSALACHCAAVHTLLTVACHASLYVAQVTAYRCQDASTARILEQIIQETTNRMNRLSQQESENEIKLFAMAGEIEQETRRAELLKVLQTHKLMEARMDQGSHPHSAHVLALAAAQVLESTLDLPTRVLHCVCLVTPWHRRATTERPRRSACVPSSRRRRSPCRASTRASACGARSASRMRSRRSPQALRGSTTRRMTST